MSVKVVVCRDGAPLPQIYPVTFRIPLDQPWKDLLQLVMDSQDAGTPLGEIFA
jgi:hypothetical protein